VLTINNAKVKQNNQLHNYTVSKNAPTLKQQGSKL